MRHAKLIALAVLGCILCILIVDAKPAKSSADPDGLVHSPIGADFIRLLGRHAATTLAPTSGVVGALVRIPSGKNAADLGLESVAPGIGRLRGSPDRVQAFGLAHPDLRIEVAPPLHPLLNRVGVWTNAAVARQTRGADGTGVMVGVADTGLDVMHAEMRDLAGHTRVKWLLDLSLKPLGKYPDLEAQYGLKDENGVLTAGAVLDGAMVDAAIANVASGACTDSLTTKCLPTDEIGHGTHVTGIAAATGAGSIYPGTAPNADIVFVRVTRNGGEGIENDDLVRAVQFMFDRQTFEKRPMVVNLSLGSDFGPHDGSFMWEQVIASSIGPDHPGRAIVAAAGNSGSILETPIHQSVHVSSGGKVRVPIHTTGATSGSVQVWVTLRPGADLKVGLDAPDGEWIAPVGNGHQAGKTTADYNAGVLFGTVDGSPVPASSHGAVVVWSGKWPSGTYSITLEGSGTAELYLQGLGDASPGLAGEAGFTNGVREGTINLPATHPSIIGVGCTVNRPSWTSIAGAEVALSAPILDAAGGLSAASPGYRKLNEGEVCWFSSAGPTALGVPKPEIAAPGALVISALSRSATPGHSNSIFTDPGCPALKNGKSDARCLQIDDTHGIAVGTSMSSPVVAGVVALLLQKDPTLTQDKVLALLQGGAHHFRGDSPFNDQSSPGEVDAMGALDALDQMANPALQLPSASDSWLTLSADYVAADGAYPFTAVLELRTAGGTHRADFFDITRLQATLAIDGKATPAPVVTRRGPGVYVFAWNPPAGMGGKDATFGATFDGQPIVTPRTVAIATDRWTAAYPSDASGSGCMMQTSSAVDGWWMFALLGAKWVNRRRRRS